MQTQQIVKHVTDGGAVGITGAAILGYLPYISALFGIIWFSIQITEKMTGKPFHELVRCAWEWIKGLRS